MSINPGNRHNWAWVLKKAWKIDPKVLQKKEFDGQY
jgi:hypothetical protein